MRTLIIGVVFLWDGKTGSCIALLGEPYGALKVLRICAARANHAVACRRQIVSLSLAFSPLDPSYTFSVCFFPLKVPLRMPLRLRAAPACTIHRYPMYHCGHPRSNTTRSVITRHQKYKCNLSLRLSVYGMRPCRRTVRRSPSRDTAYSSLSRRASEKGTLCAA